MKQYCSAKEWTQFMEHKLTVQSEWVCGKQTPAQTLSVVVNRVAKCLIWLVSTKDYS